MLKRNHVSEETHLENKEKDKNIIIYMTSCKVDTWFELFRVHINFTSFQNCCYIAIKQIYLQFCAYLDP